MYQCEQARAFDWPEGDARKRSRKAAVNWHSANAAARKLAVHFETLDDLTGSKRLAAALAQVGMRMTTKIARPLHSPPHLMFARFLRALAKQSQRRADSGYQIGPLRVGKSSQKLPSREVVLAVVLAHLFDRVANHHGNGALKLIIGEQISRGRAWEAAAVFASAALRPSVDPNAARKFLHDHRGHLFYQAWPKTNVA